MLKLLINFLKAVELFSGVFNPEIRIGKLLRSRNQTIASAESCTGGLLSSLLTDVAGSSEYIFANFVTYSNEAKTKYLGVSEETLKKYGAVSKQTAKEMAEGLLKISGCDFAIATTGIAGPGGGSPLKPVGLMYLGIANKKNTKIIEIRQSPLLYRKLMKLAFAKEALKELYLFMK